MDSPHALSDVTVYAPYTRARLGTTALFCEPAPGDDPEPEADSGGLAQVMMSLRRLVHEIARELQEQRGG